MRKGLRGEFSLCQRLFMFCHGHGHAQGYDHGHDHVLSQESNWGSQNYQLPHFESSKNGEGGMYRILLIQFLEGQNVYSGTSKCVFG